MVNGSFHESGFSCNPIGTATFELAIVFFDQSNIGLFYIEDEDQLLNLLGEQAVASATCYPRPACEVDSRVDSLMMKWRSASGSMWMHI